MLRSKVAALGTAGIDTADQSRLAITVFYYGIL